MRSGKRAPKIKTYQHFKGSIREILGIVHSLLCRCVSECTKTETGHLLLYGTDNGPDMHRCYLLMS